MAIVMSPRMSPGGTIYRNFKESPSGIQSERHSSPTIKKTVKNQNPRLNLFASSEFNTPASFRDNENLSGSNGDDEIKRVEQTASQMFTPTSWAG